MCKRQTLRMLQKLENGHILNKKSKMQHLKGLCSGYDHFPVLNQKTQSVTKWQYLGQMAENGKSEVILNQFKRWKCLYFFYLMTFGLDMAGSFKCYAYCLLKKYGGQIHLGSFCYQNFKLVSKGHKRIGNQKCSCPGQMAKNRYVLKYYK